MDTENLLKSLNAHDVDYVVIGATAFPAHGQKRSKSPGEAQGENIHIMRKASMQDQK